jgi:4'-phosphopantetheinyl transferase
MPAGPHERQVFVWSWNLESNALAGDEAEALLSDDEKTRYRSFVSPELQRRFLAARSVMRLVLAQHLDLDPKALSFVSNEFGKPRLANAKPVHFNLSHSGDRAVLAVSDAAPVGIDLERIRSVDHVDLAKRYFHPNELAAIVGRLDAADQRRAFFLIWTLKEAVVKALGCGLSIPLCSFDVSIVSARPQLAFAPEGSPPTWCLHVETMNGYCLALAVPGVGEVELIHRTF